MQLAQVLSLRQPIKSYAKNPKNIIILLIQFKQITHIISHKNNKKALKPLLLKFQRLFYLHIDFNHNYHNLPGPNPAYVYIYLLPSLHLTVISAELQSLSARTASKFETLPVYEISTPAK